MHHEKEWMDSRRHIADLAKMDIIGAIFGSEAVSEIRYFDFEKSDSGEGAVLSDKIEALIQKDIPETEKQVELSNLVAEYLYDEEIKGFREGFSVAIRIFTQGISGRASL